MLRASLLTDGSSDAVLLPILRWVIRQQSELAVTITWADLRGLRRPPRSLAERLRLAVDMYPCDLLFVHRDAERASPDLRRDEIAKATPAERPVVCVVPVRMQEAWLLLDERALREAAGRPSGTEPLSLPAARQWEALADPKARLHAALVTASGSTGRRAKRFNPRRAAHRMADLVTDWSPLRVCEAFQRLEAETRAALADLASIEGQGPGLGG